MPHIPKSEYEDVYNGRLPLTPGRLTWLVTNELVNYVIERGLSYNTILEIRVALENAGGPPTTPLMHQIQKAVATIVETPLSTQWKEIFGNAWDEFYRLVAGPYEDRAIKRNGNAYERLFEHLAKEDKSWTNTSSNCKKC